MGRPSARFSFLLSLLMVFQLVFPMFNALAADPTEPAAQTSTEATETSTAPQDESEPAPADLAPAPTSTSTTQPTKVQGLAATSSTSLPAPTDLFYTSQSPSDITLKWTGVANVTTYKIYKIAEDGSRELVAPVTGTTKVINNLPQGRTTYGVTAVSGTEESELSNLLPLNVAYPVLQPPATFTSSIKNGNDVTITWSTSEYAALYEVYQVLETGETLRVASSATTSITLTNAPQKSFTYIVKATHPLYGQSKLSAPYTVNVVHPTIQAPANLTHTIVNGNDIQVKWTASEFATGYNLYQVVDGQKVLKGTFNSSTLTKTFTNMPAGDYTYEVSAFSDRFGDSKTATSLSFTLVHPTISAPTNLAKTITNINDVKLTWSAVAYANSYKIYQVVDGQRVFKESITTTSKTYTAQPVGSYTYEVIAVSDRFGESASASITFSIGQIDLLSPTGFTQTVANGNDITLKWNAATNATSYKLYQIVNGQKELKATQTATSKVLTNMPAGDYTFEVYSYNDRLGESDPGTVLSFTLVHPVMQAPGNFTQTISNGNDFQLKWNTVAYANSYKLYQIVDGQRVLKYSGGSTSRSFTNMPAGEYSYEVTAVSDRFGESSIGTQLTFPLVLPTMQAPANLTKTIINANDIKLAWGTTTYATSYKIYQVIDGQKVFKETVTTLNKTYTNMPAASYTFVVHSYSDRFGESAEGASITFSLGQTELQAPTNLTNTISNGNDFQLKWAAATNATSYKIYQIVDGTKELKATVTTLNKSFTNMPAGDYSFEVYSFSDRFGESDTGAEISFTLVHPIMEKPANLTQSVLNGNDIRLAWAGVTYANSYKIYQIADGKKELAATVTALNKIFTNMPAGDYSYEVYSYSDRFGESPVGSAISLTLVHPIMAAPTGPNYTILNGNDIQLKWSAATYATGYKVYQIIDGQKVFKENVVTINKTYTNQAAGNYSYVIHSYSDRFGESPVGSEINLTLVHPIMQAPTGLANTIANGNDIVLSWRASAFATEYRVYQVANGQKTLVSKGTTLTKSFPNLPEGDYAYEVTSYSDRFGESAPTQVLKVNLVHPTMTAPVATATVVNTNNVKVSWTAIPFTTSYYVYRIIDGQTYLLRIVSGSATNTTFSFLAADRYEYVVTAFSDRFGTSPESNTVVADLFFDSVTPVTTSNISSAWQKGSVAVTLAATDNKSGVAKTFYSIGGAPFVEGTQFTVTKEGQTEVAYYSVDRSGNTEATQTAVVKIDATAPVTTATAPTGWSTKPVTLALNATDANSGVAKTFYSINGAPVVQGNSVALNENGIYKVDFYSVDTAGNTEAVQSTEVKIDQTAPVTKSDVASTWSKGSVTVTLTATDNLSGVAKTFYSVNGGEFVEGTSFVTDKAGLNTVSFYSVDVAGNQEATKTAEVLIDGLAPVTTSDVQDIWYKEAVNVTLTATDADSGVAKTLYSVDGVETLEGTSFKVSKPGINTITFYSIDVAGNKEATKTAQVKIDGNAPVTTSDVQNVWNREAVTVNLTATDAETGVAQTFYSLNGVDFIEGTSFTVDQEGINEVAFYSVDVAGNKEEVKTATVKIDKTVPVTASDIKDTWYEAAVPVTLTATDNLSGVEKTYYMIDNSGDFIEGTSFLVEKPGITTVSFYSVDAAGNKEEAKTVQVKIDGNAPVTTSDVQDVWNREAVAVTLTATDAETDVAKTFYSINGGAFVEGTSFTVDQEGLNKVSFYSVDLAGNQEEAKTATVKIDKTAPVTTSNATDAWSKENVVVKFAATDNLSGVAKTFHSVNGGAFVEGTSVTVDKEGINKVSFYSVDVAGNREATKTVDVKIDKTAPLLSIDLNTQIVIGSLKLNYLTQDNVSGVSTELMTVTGPGTMANGTKVKNGESINLTEPGQYTVTITVTDAAGWTTTIKKNVLVYIPATVEVTPQVIKGNKGVFTVRVTLPQGFSTQGFDLNTATVNGVKALNSNNGYYNQAKSGQFKFERSDFTWNTSEVTLEFRGYVNGQLVVGKTNVKVNP